MVISATEKDNSQPIVVVGRDELYAADVIPGEKNRLCVDLGNSQADISSSLNLDAFGRLRISEAVTRYAFIPRSGKALGDEWDEQITGNATITFNDNNTSIDLNTTTTSGDKAVRQTLERFIYTAGKSNFILMTANFESLKANNRKRIGLFDSKDGWFFEQRGTEFGVCIRSNVGGSVTDYYVAQANWNVDKMDGTGASGVTLDFTKTQILVVDYQWLGIGRVRFGFVVDGALIYIHYANHANRQSFLYMQHPHLPFRAECENTGTTATASSFKTTCFSLAVEGDERKLGKVVPFSSGTTEYTILSTETYMFSVSLRPSYYRHVLEPISFQTIMASGTKAVIVRVYVNTNLTNPSWINIGEITRYDRLATAFSASSGKLIQEYFINVNGSESINPINDLRAAIELGSRIDDTPVNLTLTAQTLGGNAKMIYSVFMREHI